MPWSASSTAAQREKFVRHALGLTQSHSATCRAFGISRKTGYKWLRRYHQLGISGLEDRSRRPPCRTTAKGQLWRQRVGQARHARPHWGSKKLRVMLRGLHPREHLPSERSIGRWLKHQGLSARRSRQRPAGPRVPHPGLTEARRVHQVWTVDFKGWFRTADGAKQEPLTVRDARSRYLLALELLPSQDDGGVRKVMQRLFESQGLPTAIRVDNGSPFASKGPLNLSRLSVWWLRLGIRVEFTRRARPGDNAAHEQMHSCFKAEVLKSPAANRADQQRLCDQWREDYNQRRPHEALRQRTPQSCYRKSSRLMPAPLPPLKHPHAKPVRRVRSTGAIKWQGKMCFIGRAFAGQQVALKPDAPGVQTVWFGRLLIGTIHDPDTSAMRPAHWSRSHLHPLKV